MGGNIVEGHGLSCVIRLKSWTCVHHPTLATAPKYPSNYLGILGLEPNDTPHDSLILEVLSSITCNPELLGCQAIIPNIRHLTSHREPSFPATQPTVPSSAHGYNKRVPPLRARGDHINYSEVPREHRPVSSFDHTSGNTFAYLFNEMYRDLNPAPVKRSPICDSGALQWVSAPIPVAGREGLGCTCVARRGLRRGCWVVGSSGR